MAGPPRLEGLWCHQVRALREIRFRGLEFRLEQVEFVAAVGNPGTFAHQILCRVVKVLDFAALLISEIWLEVDLGCLIFQAQNRRLNGITIV